MVKTYVGGKGLIRLTNRTRLRNAPSSLFPNDINAPLFMVNPMHRKLFNAFVRYAEGRGMRVPGSGYSASGLIVPGTSGNGFFDDVAKFFSRTVPKTAKNLVTSNVAKTASKTARQFATPLLKKAVPMLIDNAPALLTKTGVLAPLAPVAAAATPFVKAPLEQLSNKGIDELNSLASKEGYGMTKQYHGSSQVRREPRYASSSGAPAYAKTRRQLGKQSHNSALDNHEVRVFHDLAVSAPLKHKAGAKSGGALLTI